MDWQQLTSLALVAGTVAALAWSRFRKGKLGVSRGLPCGSCATAGGQRTTRVILRARKGERPEVHVKLQ